MKHFFSDIIKYYSYAVRSAKSSLKTEVASSYLNWIWWILDPLFNMIIYYIVFGRIFNDKHQYHIIFIFIGLTMWNFFNKNVVQSVNMIKRNKAIVAKVYIPKYILLISNMMVNGFKMMICWVIVALMMMAYRVPLSWNIIMAFPVLLMLILFTFAVCVNMMHYGVFVEDLSNVTNIVLKLMFYLTGIFYSVEDKLKDSMPDHPKLGKYVTLANPIALAIRDMRNSLLYQHMVSWKGLLVWAFVSIVLACIGIRTIYKNENSYVKVI